MATANNNPAPDVVRRLETLIYYAVDKASPYSLAYSISTDSLGKILDFKLAELAITPRPLVVPCGIEAQNHWSSSSPVGMWAGCI